MLDTAFILKVNTLPKPNNEMNIWKVKTSWTKKPNILFPTLFQLQSQILTGKIEWRLSENLLVFGYVALVYKLGGYR